jgi:hypothetical protein
MRAILLGTLIALFIAPATWAAADEPLNLPSDMDLLRDPPDIYVPPDGPAFENPSPDCNSCNGFDPSPGETNPANDLPLPDDDEMRGPEVEPDIG